VDAVLRVSVRSVAPEVAPVLPVVLFVAVLVLEPVVPVLLVLLELVDGLWPALVADDADVPVPRSAVPDVFRSVLL